MFHAAVPENNGYPQQTVTAHASLEKRCLLASRVLLGCWQIIQDSLLITGGPGEDEAAQKRADEDTDDKVAIVVHGQQHDKVGYTELDHVQQRAQGVLQQGRTATEGTQASVGACSLGATDVGSSSGSGGGGGGGVVVVVVVVVRLFELLGGRGVDFVLEDGPGQEMDEERGLAGGVFVELMAQTAEELEGHDEQDDADAGAGEHAL